ncbi:hypothetical protein QF028_000357 [Neobacillus sp. B4I6]
MKRSTKRIIERFPTFKSKLKAYENISTNSNEFKPFII